MRGIATFFMVIFTLGSLGALVLFATETETYSDSDLFGRALLVIGCISGAFATWHGSRTGAIFVLLLLLITPLMGIMGLVQLRAIDWSRSAVYIAFAIAMVFSAMRYVSESEYSNLDVQGNSLLRWTGKIVTACVLAVFGFGMALISNDTTIRVLKGSEISPSHLEWLVEQNFLLPDEKPLYFYVDGVFSIEEGGSLLTDQYVGAWWKEDGTVTSHWTKLGEICEVETRNEGG